MNGQFTKGHIPYNKGEKRPELSGENHPMFGKSHSEESIQKMKDTFKKKYPNGRPVWNKGKPMSEAIKKKVSDSKKGKPSNSPTKFKKGIPHTEEWKRSRIGSFTGNKNPRWKGGITNSERKKYLNGRRRARKLNAEGSHTEGEWELLKKQYGFTCPCCQRSEPEIKLSEDHIIPLSRGGSDFIENIQPLCKSCNSKKYNKIIDYHKLTNI